MFIVGIRQSQEVNAIFPYYLLSAYLLYILSPWTSCILSHH